MPARYEFNINFTMKDDAAREAEEFKKSHPAITHNEIYLAGVKAIKAKEAAQ